MKWLPCIVMVIIFLPMAIFIGGAGLHLICLIISEISSQEAEKLERQKRKDELKRLEQALKKNCPGYYCFYSSSEE